MVDPTPADLARDLLADLELCEQLDSMQCDHEDGGRRNKTPGEITRSNELLLDAARTGWPATIRRAMAAESELTTLRARVAELEGKTP